MERGRGAAPGSRRQGQVWVRPPVKSLGVTAGCWPGRGLGPLRALGLWSPTTVSPGDSLDPTTDTGAALSSWETSDDSIHGWTGKVRAWALASGFRGRVFSSARWDSKGPFLVSRAWMLPTDGQVKHLHIPCPSKGTTLGTCDFGKERSGCGPAIALPTSGLWLEENPASLVGSEPAPPTGAEMLAVVQRQVRKMFLGGKNATF